jgi:16S rRNA (guanine966-N2)-methyltransferase
MQVTGGRIRGNRLKVPRKAGVRPTTSVVRQAIFSILENSAVDWNRVLDLYAGSGTLGIEALSRKAQWVDFVDQNRKCCDIIRANLQKARLSDRAHVYCCSVNKAIAFLDNRYNIIFIDPPYSDHTLNGLIGNLAVSELLMKDSIVVVCHDNRFALDSSLDGLNLVTERKYGGTLLSIFHKELEA